MKAECKHIIPNDVLLGEVRRLIAEGHAVVLRVKGASMWPFVVGGRDSVRLVRPDGLRERDIVLAEIAAGHYVLHRIRRIEAGDVTLMGDGNLRGVEHCRAEDVVGRVEAIVRRGREVNPYSTAERRRVALWLWLTPIRRWLLAAGRLWRRTQLFFL